MFEELGETVTRTEFRELHATVGRLAEAQERTAAQVAALLQVTQSLAETGNRTANRLDAAA